MELPDDILSIIHEFSYPLKRRKISNYWIGQGIEHIDEMASIVFYEFIKGHIDQGIITKKLNEWHIYEIYEEENDKELVLRFNERELLEWSGEFNYEDDIGDFYILCKDEFMYKQLLNNVGVVKEKRYFILD